jgi:hypothetical protein
LAGIGINLNVMGKEMGKGMGGWGVTGEWGPPPHGGSIYPLNTQGGKNIGSEEEVK